MNLAWLSLAALLIVIVVSCISKLNVGVLAIAMAWVLGVYFGGLKLDEIVAGFPAQLFLMLCGVTFLFTQAQANGTLDKLAHRAVASCRGNSGIVPVMFFLVAATVASLGPGNIATAALLAPMAMAVAERAKIPAFLMAIMVGNGANAGSLSPLAPTGVIATGLMSRIGLPGLEWQTFASNFFAHAIVAFGGYLLFGGIRLFRVRYERAGDATAPATSFERENWITLVSILALVVGVIFFKINVGMAAFVAAIILGLTQSADLGESIRKAPWNVIVMVSGVTMLIALLERTGGLSLFTELLAKFATSTTVTAMIAFVTGLISTYSSTSGVVLPAFLPTVPSLADRLGADAKSIAFSINVGSHLVDVSPLSTIGALCVASVASEESRTLFNKLMAWGLSMTLVSALLCFILFGRN